MKIKRRLRDLERIKSNIEQDILDHNDRVAAKLVKKRRDVIGNIEGRTPDE